MRDVRKTETEWVIAAAPRLFVPFGAAAVLLGAAASVYFYRHREIGVINGALIVGAVILGGMFMLTYRRTLTLDRGAKRVRILTRYFGLPFSQTLPANGTCYVERWTQRATEGGNTDMFDVVMNGRLLIRLSEHHGEGRADALARDFAAFLGLAHAPPRISNRERARQKFIEKNAFVPLAVVVALMFAAAIFYLLAA